MFRLASRPGDKEDVIGRPFVGPRRQSFWTKRSRLQAIDRSEVYLTNIVKHFQLGGLTGAGKRRIHKKAPAISEIQACRPNGFDAEIKVTAATANRLSWRNPPAQALFGKRFSA